ncbi:cation:proton antiporter SCDLUD_003126 [Saccharomycodes ludwigii]|uniref:cation:proton antiporter n=1 Tax=Saccharomycodes ludwigii TaxID=36035 RepID=UPI001E8AD78F|nr:hypothetical protein SCDLUD_003126 [Saccharomycodes ludwigii]KAH3900156.1 hypothetical protein SCDLUD_003126 [Saccharomycodes ludwigii]
MEDIPNIILIPIYFAVAGLNVNLTLLNEKRDWGFIFASIGVALASKIISSSIMAKLNGLRWRESFAVGILMSCKGIVEIVVLTTGLNAGIISKKIYAMFILMALVSTFITTPMTIWQYPNSYREKLIKEQKDAENKEEGISEVENEGTVTTNIETYDLDTMSAKESLLAPVLTENLNSSRFMSLDDLSQFHFTNIICVIENTDSISCVLSLLNYMLFNGGMKKTNTIANEHRPHRNLRNRLKKYIGHTTSSTLQAMKKGDKRSRIDDASNCDGDNFEVNMNTIDRAPTGVNGDCIVLDEKVSLRLVHLRRLTERTADLLYSSSMHNSKTFNFDSSNDSLFQIFNIFSELNQVPFRSDVIFSTVSEKASNIISIKALHTDFVLIPLQGIRDNSYRVSEMFTDEVSDNEAVFSHLTNINELPVNYFQVLAKGMTSNLGILIHNSRNKFERPTLNKRYFYLLLPNANFSSTDYLSIYVFILLCYNSSNKNADSLKFSIFINKDNAGFEEDLYQAYGQEAWFQSTDITVVQIDAKDAVTSRDYDKTNKPFIALVMEQGLSHDEINNIDESLFIISERLFSKMEPFGREVTQAISYSFRTRYDILICHHHIPN